MRVGVPREIKPDEYRVGLTPTAVREYVSHGHQVIVEAGAGVGAGYADGLYERAGARIAPDADAVFADAHLIVKVKEPQAVEWARLTKDHILFTYLHLAPDPDQANGLLQSGCAAIAYETVTDPQGGLPLLAPMSEVAGRIAVFSAGETLLKHNGGMGLLIGGVPGVPPARVLVLGGGVVGMNAARMAAGLGAEVVVVERSIPRMRELDNMFQGRVLTRYSTQDAVDEEVLKADVVIGAVLTAGASAPTLVKKAHLAKMKPGSVLVDVSIDQGGCFETSRPTTHKEPTYIVDGVVHYCVANMPGAAPRTSSEALVHATLPFGLQLADKGLDALKINKHLAKGLNVLAGEITHPAVAEALGKPFKDPYGAWA
ncbi:MAG: alanine dehydrogenase [Alphaproteobacteria bacterium]|nr:alanine dehydrogenase [Alphaproteobacteria bacterium]MBU1517237.1 alanine dehydrogenase [Alphaproteobacteria bacterium]MBU2093227.1 alanine dehydrogenase [Alphaproteobacteria bacterium]MBU2153147.1 alanine dehydrogenase [Alphaproteobacteria bacterium]MBU2307853.1 alanine dehydrogenase [Alphaproteobacteria bacterium]